MTAEPEDTAAGEAQGPPSFHADLRDVYSQLDAAVAQLAPVCRVSGRCCRFREHGHTLFLSDPEVEFLLSKAPAPARPLDQGVTCPWQDAHGRCTAREARPLGCRVYFCDPAYQEAAPALSEHFIMRLKRLAERHGMPWNYAPLHRHLHERAEQIRFPDTPRASGPA
jgi:Fe-S-cluster containining protein